jgi:hypothetical protein
MDEIDQNRKKPATKRQSTKKQPIVQPAEIVDNWKAEQGTGSPSTADKPIEVREWEGATPIEQPKPIEQKPPEDIEQQAKRKAFEVTKRLQREGRWNDTIRDDLIKQARSTLRLGQTEAKLWAYEELDRRFPPIIDQSNSEATNNTPNQRNANNTDDQNQANDDQNDEQTAAGNDSLSPSGRRRKAENTDNPRTHARDSVIGIGKLPATWPTLPANASLTEEIQWVQANRMRVVSETPDGTRVHLKRSLSPAPSHSALGWLETSIRAYAKYCEIAAKASNTVEDGRDQARRERLKIDEVRNLLSEMAEA